MGHAGEREDDCAGGEVFDGESGGIDGGTVRLLTDLRNFSRGRTSIWRTRWAEIPYLWDNSSNPVGLSLRRRSTMMWRSRSLRIVNASDNSALRPVSSS